MQIYPEEAAMLSTIARLYVYNRIDEAIEISKKIASYSFAKKIANAIIYQTTDRYNEISAVEIISIANDYIVWANKNKRGR